MAQWLFKTEPGDYSWDDFVKDGRTDWDGVKNHQAAANMRAMKLGEKAYFYRSLKDPAVLGVMEIVKEAYPDPDDEKGKFVRVDVQPAGLLPAPVPLSAIKADGRLNDLALVRQSRLSVMPVSDEHWALIEELANTLANAPK